MKTCPICRGSGASEIEELNQGGKCKSCSGTGQVNEPRYVWDGESYIPEEEDEEAILIAKGRRYIEMLDEANSRGEILLPSRIQKELGLRDEEVQDFIEFAHTVLGEIEAARIRSTFKPIRGLRLC